jgi:hypothetical protein
MKKLKVTGGFWVCSPYKGQTIGLMVNSENKAGADLETDSGYVLTAHSFRT